MKKKWKRRHKAALERIAEKSPYFNANVVHDLYWILQSALGDSGEVRLEEDPPIVRRLIDTLMDASEEFEMEQKRKLFDCMVDFVEEREWLKKGVDNAARGLLSNIGLKDWGSDEDTLKEIRTFFITNMVMGYLMQPVEQFEHWKERS